MNPWALLSTRNPLWRAGGWALAAAVAGLTGYYMTQGPKPLQPEAGGAGRGQGGQGRFGTFVEQMGDGMFLLSYETLSGTQEAILLDKVSGRLEEPLTTWTMLSPKGRRDQGVWTLMGPMDVEARDPKTQVLGGKGAMKEEGPALRWDRGVWTGLSTLVWDDYDGNGKGRWILPPGWHRGLDGLFRVDRGPVHWEAAEPGALRTLEADRMVAGLGFREGNLAGVNARMDGGAIQADRVQIQATEIVFDAPVTFQRDDGWRGSASHGSAPRPPQGQAFDRMEFKDFRAQRAVEGGAETLASAGARWTRAGLRLEGDVRWDQPLDGQKATLRAPRVLQRSGPGEDLPAGLAAGETWAEPQAVLAWGPRTLSSPRIEGRHKERTWRIQAPALGRGEMGTFSAGEGRGSLRRWSFQGPVQARFFDGSQVRSDGLVWEDNVMTLTGRPATWTRLRQRLAGPTVVRSRDAAAFPQGLSGALAGQEGDITIRANQGVARNDQVDLEGRVETQGRDWRLQADRISVTLGPGNVVKLMTAKGSVILRGRMGEGRGDALDLDPQKQVATWHGGVKVLTEVRP